MRGQLDLWGRWTQDHPTCPGLAHCLCIAVPPLLLETLLSGHGCSLPTEGAPQQARQRESARPRAGCISAQVGTGMVSELRVRSNRDSASIPEAASLAGGQPGSPIDPRPCRRAFEIRLPLPGSAPRAPVVSFPNPLHSNGFGIF